MLILNYWCSYTMLCSQDPGTTTAAGCGTNCSTTCSGASTNPTPASSSGWEATRCRMVPPLAYSRSITQVETWLCVQPWVWLIMVEQWLPVADNCWEWSVNHMALGYSHPTMHGWASNSSTSDESPLVTTFGRVCRCLMQRLAASKVNPPLAC